MSRPRGPWGPERAFLGYSVPYEDARYVILPVPYDSTASCRPGARFGPRQVIDASLHLETFDPHSDLDLSELPIHTLPEPSVPRGDHEAVLELVGSLTRRIVSDGKTPIVLGGDHSVTIGSFAGVGSAGGLAFISLDAHLDSYDEFEGSRRGHASVTARCSERATASLVVGARSAGREEVEAARRRGVKVVWAWDLKRDLTTLSRALRGLEGAEAYVSFDVDVLDPSLVPCTGCPEPGGLDWYEAVQAVETILAEIRAVAVDFVELGDCSARPDAPYLVAKLVARVIGALERRQ